MGGGGRTVNVAVAEPPAVVSVIVRSPGAADAAIVNLADADEFDAVTLLTTISAPASMANPATRFVPVIAISTTAPLSPLLGVTAVIVGGDGITVNVTGPLVPPAVDTRTERSPKAALESIV